ncbi:MAG: extracellular solute-binding protein [Clostridiales bacterium]|jgi:N-acetylglucosamine transport system substrate-binding protein|nr:extracellular solute-binding protein [Clostridiales bacterium]
MKKTLRFLFLALCVAVACLSFACNPGGGGDREGDDKIPEQLDDSDRSGWVLRERETFPAGSKLRVKFFNGGYGRAWIDAMKTRFEADYPTVEVTLIASNQEADFTTLLGTALDGTPDDIYICHNIPWEKLAKQGKIANLDSVYNAEIYHDDNTDLPVRFLDRVCTSSLNSVRFEGSYYKVPEVQGAGGIAYNKALFDANGWTLPTTYAELITLCETISASGAKTKDGETVYPFVWSGTEAYLWDSLVYDWWVQLAGTDEFNRFMRFEDKAVFNPDEYPYLKQAWAYWYDLVCGRQSFSHPQSLAFSNLQCNMAFAAGQAAMMPATCWVANEIGADILSQFQCDIGLASTPFVPDAKRDAEGKPIRVSYDLAGKDSIVVAQKGKNKAVAMEFLKWMSEEENAVLFPKNTNGLLLAMRYDFDGLLRNVAESTWETDMFNILKDSTRFNLYSSSPMVYLAGTPLSPYPDGNYYGEAFEYYGDSAKPVRTPDVVFDAVWERMDRDWDMMRAAVGLS